MSERLTNKTGETKMKTKQTSLKNRDSVVMNNDSILAHILLCMSEGLDVNLKRISAACDGRFDAAQCATRILNQTTEDRTDIPRDVISCFVTGQPYLHGPLTAWYIAEMLFCAIATLADNDDQAISMLAGAQ